MQDDKRSVLFDPFDIKNVKFKNRIAMAPMRTVLDITKKNARIYFLERAKGGVGMITTGATSPDLLIDDQSWGYKGSAKRYCRRLKNFTKELHFTGVKIGLQLWHGNRYPAGKGTHQENRGELVAPSSTHQAREIKTDEIKNIILKFGQAASKAKEAGFDFVEIHGAHGYLLCQFFSPASNRRNDEFGGNNIRRMRFGLEIVSSVRKNVGADFPLFYRLPAADFNISTGITIKESQLFAKVLKDAGVDLISVSVGGESDSFGNYDLPHNTIGPGPDQKEGTYSSFAGMIRKSAGIPVAAVGRFRTKSGAENAIKKEEADIIIMGRQLIAPCISCNYCFQSRNDSNGLKCSVNGFVYHEKKYKMDPPKKSRRIMIVGGGPAGLKAAAVLAARGHNVALYEKKNSLGGLLRLALKPPMKSELNHFLDYLIRQTEKYGARIKTGIEIDPELIKRKAPDVLVLATGSLPVIPEIPGVDKSCVVQAIDLLSTENHPIGKTIIIGGQSIACETADYLSESGIDVTIAAQSSLIAGDMFIGNRNSLISRLVTKNVVILNNIQKYIEITDNGLEFINESGKTCFLNADTIALATGAVPNRKIMKKVNRLAEEVYFLGDCRNVGRIADAIKDGIRIGCSIK